jgi:hypothetical protein
MPRRNDQNDAFGQEDLQPLEKNDERNANREKRSLAPYHLRADIWRLERSRLLTNKATIHWKSDYHEVIKGSFSTSLVRS